MVRNEYELASCLPAEGITLHEVNIALTKWECAQSGRVFAVTLGETECDVWLPESVWQTWCEAVIGCSDANLIDPLLLAGIAEWGLSPLLSASDVRMTRSNGYPRSCSCLPQLALTFSWQIDHHHFSALLLGWPAIYFQSIAKQEIPAVRPIHLLPPLAFPCYAGWCSLLLSELRGLNVGDGVRMQTFGNIRAGEFILSLSSDLVARVNFGLENNMQINELVQNVESLLIEEQDELDGQQPQPMSIDELPQRLLVEVGVVDVSLGDLRVLSVGDLLPADVRFGTEVRLKLSGRIIGTGELVGCGDSFLVRINRWYLKPTEVG